MSADKVNPERLPFDEPEPYAEAVNLAVLLDEIVQLIRRYLIVDQEQAETAALWVVHTYLIQQASVSPIAIINAPERACAKTLFQTVLGRMVYRPLQASNSSASALFRGVEKWQPTILLDEADTFFKERPELHGLVNAGYSKTGFVLRSEVSGDVRRGRHLLGLLQAFTAAECRVAGGHQCHPGRGE